MPFEHVCEVRTRGFPLRLQHETDKPLGFAFDTDTVGFNVLLQEFLGDRHSCVPLSIPRSNDRESPPLCWLCFLFWLLYPLQFASGPTAPSARAHQIGTSHDLDFTAPASATPHGLALLIRTRSFNNVQPSKSQSR